MKPEEYLTDFTPPPIDEEEIREALAAALKQRAPPALIRLVGRQAYSRCAARRPPGGGWQWHGWVPVRHACMQTRRRVHRQARWCCKTYM